MSITNPRLTWREAMVWAMGVIISLVLIVGAATKRLPLSLPEVFGFVSGAACVGLTVRQSIWNFPIGLLNNLFFGILFWESRLFADMGLQFVYLVLGILGWMWWTRGGREAAPLPVARADGKSLEVLIFLVVAGTVLMRFYLIQVSGASPLWDGLTTSISLAAQYLLSRKWLENWGFWIAADLIYIPLYFSRGLYLTSALYFGFLLLCVAGFMGWKRSLGAQEA